MTALSPRHREIVELVGRDGKTYKEAGEVLRISSHTVRQHVRVICDRVGQNGKRPRAVLTRLYWTEVAEPK